MRFKQVRDSWTNQRPRLLWMTRISPIKALFWSAVINGLCAGPIMVLVMLMCSKLTFRPKKRMPVKRDA
jgi:hypothetical protein